MTKAQWTASRSEHYASADALVNGRRYRIRPIQDDPWFYELVRYVTATRRWKQVSTSNEPLALMESSKLT